MNVGHVLYWLLTGALIGFGAIAILSIGFPFILLGLILVVFGAVRLGGAGLWAALVGCGALPAAILGWDLASAPWACATPGSEGLPNVNYFSCVDTFLGPLTTYHVLAFGFALIALAGLAWRLLHRLLARPQGAAT
ncbi:MAG TPA: hypothetical protein VID73_10560 [Ktedonobacterales bacterium]